MLGLKLIHVTKRGYRSLDYEDMSVLKSLLGIITWLLCFSPASIDSSLVSADSSPASTDSSLLPFLLLEPSPLQQSGRSPKVVALFSATNFSNYIIELLQLQDAIQIQWNYAWIHYNIAKRSHLMI